MIELKAYAKLNISLGVLYRRMDGYHVLDSVMQTISLHDKLTIVKAKGVEVYVSGATLPKDNTMRRAAELYKKVTGCGCVVRCQKNIPMEAGMGGGSADAAAVLRGLQRLHRMADDRELMSIALSVGADVPFLIRGGTARCEGVGEIITPFKAQELNYVIAKPSEGVSTGALFRSLELKRQRVQTLKVMSALSTGNLQLLAESMANTLEVKAIEFVPQIAVLKQQLISLGAVAAQMSGSGSAVFGIFESEQQAIEACNKLEGAHFKCVAKSVL